MFTSNGRQNIQKMHWYIIQIDFNKDDINIFINDTCKWHRATIKNNKATIQNNKATYTSLFMNEKVKSTLTRQLLPQNRPESACFSFSYEDTFWVQEDAYELIENIFNQEVVTLAVRMFLLIYSKFQISMT